MVRASSSITRALAVLALASTSLVALPSLPAHAQTAAPADTADARIRRMEAEIRALQRQVFPGGAGRFFEPEIASGQTGAPTGATTGNVPPSTAVGDILTRLDALEGQLARLTAQVEEGGNRMNRLETRIAALEPAPVVNSSGTAAGTGVGSTATVTPTAAPSPAPTPTPAPTAERLAAVQAVEKPQSGDAGEDEYIYGARLWEAKLYPEAAQQLQLVIDRYPEHPRISRARNLLGRAYLDDNKPGTAAPIFLDNYRKAPRGDRAPDSLLYLGVSMTRRNDATRACASFAELLEVYPDVAAGRLSTQLARAKAEARCN